ncbi:prenyltransferase [Pontibacter sp. JAM-7]|uniref:prenyltransferase n=1 Tax=Pontibacter sp. JAM-7 TaxID=3366581 RepID=UPI003AF7B01C
MIFVSKYNFRKALRPFSLSVSLVACSTGLFSAYRDGFYDTVTAVLVLLSGVLLQAGVNLINDYADGHGLADEFQRRIRRNFFCGLIAFAATVPMALYLIMHSGPGLMWLIFFGVVGAIGYTMEPINYKRRGLGVPLVFWLMGMLMVAGAYYAQAGQFAAHVWLQAVPISVLVAMLLLSNELRDYESDKKEGMLTLSVRLGYQPAMWLFRAGLLLSYLLAFVWVPTAILPAGWLVIFAFPLAAAPWLLSAKQDPVARKLITVMTGRLLAGFGFFYCAAFLINPPL